jgi:hypothetical protein
MFIMTSYVDPFYDADKRNAKKQTAAKIRTLMQPKTGRTLGDEEFVCGVCVLLGARTCTAKTVN